MFRKIEDMCGCRIVCYERHCITQGLEGTWGCDDNEIFKWKLNSTMWYLLCERKISSCILFQISIICSQNLTLVYTEIMDWIYGGKCVSFVTISNLTPNIGTFASSECWLERIFPSFHLSLTYPCQLLNLRNGIAAFRKAQLYLNFLFMLHCSVK